MPEETTMSDTATLPSWHDLPGIRAALNAQGEVALSRRLQRVWKRLESLLADEAEDAPDYDPTLTRFARLKAQAFELLEARA